MNITKHALKRMKGKYFIKNGAQGRFVMTGQVDGNIWTIVFDSDVYTVITVRRAHKDEEALWNSK